MANVYKFALNYNVALLSLAPILWQPRTDSTVQAVVREYAISGSIHESGLFIALLYSAFDDPTDYAAQVAQFDLTANLTRQITLYCPDEQFVWHRYNGLIAKPSQGDDVKRSDYFVKDAVFLVTRLFQLA